MTAKLYALRDPKGQLVKDAYFAKKKEAKEARNKLSADAGFEKEHILHGDAYTVTMGPEHPHVLFEQAERERKRASK